MLRILILVKLKTKCHFVLISKIRVENKFVIKFIKLILMYFELKLSFIIHNFDLLLYSLDLGLLLKFSS
jgi:hypothetical protein